MNPRAATNDLLPFQGSPFNHLGTSALVDSHLAFCKIDIQFCTRNSSLWLRSTVSGESGIRTHAPLRTNGFQDRLVMTTSISLHIMFFNIFCAVLSAHVVFYHQISPLSITNLIFFSKNWTYSFNFCYMSIFTGIFTLFCSLFYSLFSFKNASATTRSSGVVILILR